MSRLVVIWHELRFLGRGHRGPLDRLAERAEASVEAALREWR